MDKINLENLEIDCYHLYQDKGNFNFGIDAVLLANFALRESNITKAVDTASHSVRVNSTSPIKICDLCSGTLPIPLIIYAKSHMDEHCEPTPRRGELCARSLTKRACRAKCDKVPLGCEPSLHIDAFEIDKDQTKLSQKSVLWNKENVPQAKNIDQDINVYNEDIKNIFLDREKYKNLYESYDLVTVNPPYNKKGSGLVNINDKVISARHEILVTFDDVCHAANLLLKSKKRLYFINQTSRFTEIVTTLKKYSFEMKKVAFVHPYVNKPSNLFLAEAVKSGREGVKVLEPIIIYEKGGSYTEKVLKIYGK
ncbi:MAG: hypothetical protein IJT67_01205 [Lachnospiraceae bacterium]|nr:hypothetical protein [Lachnospiraceae bacterium]